MKKCSKCNIEKDLSCFSKNYTMCKACKSQYDKQYQIDHKEEISENKKQYHQNNKEKINKNSATWRQNNPDRNRNLKKEWKKNNRENNSIFRLREAISAIIWAALKRNHGSKKGGSFLDKLPYTIQELKEHLESQFEPWMSWNNWGVYNSKIWDDYNTLTWFWQIDHIVPQSKLPYTSMEDDNFKKCWALENLQPLSAKENNIKRDKLL